MAEQREPVKRRVALKIIQLGGLAVAKARQRQGVGSYLIVLPA